MVRCEDGSCNLVQGSIGTHDCSLKVMDHLGPGTASVVIIIATIHLSSRQQKFTDASEDLDGQVHELCLFVIVNRAIPQW